MSENSSEQLELIETKLAYQEKTISDLNEVVVRQQQQIDQLLGACKHLAAQLSGLLQASGADHSGEEPPPHY